MSWGNKLLFAFIVFAAGMIFLVYRAMSTNFEMVEKDYYKQELRYQEKINGIQEANNLTAPVELSQSETGIHLRFPLEMKNKTLSGNVWFYCAYDEKKDKRFNLQTDMNGNQSFALDELQPGNYTVKINWMDGEKKYYTEQTITVL